ncbi:UDP-N-acetylglucosamine 2-epimerase [Mucilaginibacter calamicampi]|uniref:UDP-N-acetylglucosamine 2-epimerase n=1 Tax=Mucilaginibacter calamicampi TaxID=1302352 RepID=A0ABW2YUJ7_9SPHI
MHKRKVCVITGTRAEYGLLYWVMKSLKNDKDVELQIIATGMHLSPEFGLTYKQIEADGFVIDKKVETLLSSDTPVGIGKSMGLGMIGFSDAYQELQPDILLVLGDRFEIFAAVSSAMVARIPVAHCHGGEATQGLIDEAIRHSITKMSHLHFTSTEQYRNRIIQMGEQPQHVYNTGALGIENINKMELLDREQFEDSIAFKLNKRSILVTFHPVTLEFSTAEVQFKALLDAISELQDCTTIFTRANADTDGRIINVMIDKYAANHPDKAVAFTSLGQLRYLSALRHVDIVVGNSSSGLIEAPSFKKPTVNIGDRQSGRIKGVSVIDCEPNYSAIKSAIENAFDTNFVRSLENSVNEYGQKNASEVILPILKSADLESLLKKKFYNIDQ